MTPNSTLIVSRRLALIALIGFLVVSFFLPVRSLAFTDPDTFPPEYNSVAVPVPELLNNSGATTGTSVQRIGTLLIGSSGDPRSLCLNPLLSNYDGLHPQFYPGTSDLGDATTVGNCISSWATLSGAPGLLTDADLLTLRNPAPEQLPTLTDSGYSTWQAKPTVGGNGQLFSLISERPSVTTDGTAIRTEGLSSSYYAAEFKGTLGVGSENFPGRLCLNDQDPNVPGAKNANCKSTWDEVRAVSQAELVLLQNMHSPPTVAVPYPITPSAGQTSSAGLLVAEAYVAGNPVNIATVYTCGDAICQPLECKAGFCQAWQTICAVDCI